MAGTAQTPAYKKFLTDLVALRLDQGMSQAKLATELNKPASFVGKYELGERRLDVSELMVILNVLGADREAFLDQLEDAIPRVL